MQKGKYKFIILLFFIIGILLIAASGKSDLKALTKISVHKLSEANNSIVAVKENRTEPDAKVTEDMTEKALVTDLTPKKKASKELAEDIFPESNDVTNLSETEVTLIKRLIVIDAGHQRKGNYDLEPIGPGASKTKAKVSSGTQGIVSKVPEYELTLIISLMLRDELINRGYDIVMIRDDHDVNISNRERAEIANHSGADIFLRIHADSSNDSRVHGASTLYPSEQNSYVSHLSVLSQALSEAVLEGLCSATGAKNRGTIARDDMSGINWSEIPVTIVEMGYMSNPEEDRKMQTDSYKEKIVQGICDGIDFYFASLA